MVEHQRRRLLLEEHPQRRNAVMGVLMYHHDSLVVGAHNGADSLKPKRILVSYHPFFELLK